MPHPWYKPIRVYCVDCMEQYDEREVKILNIEEGMQGEDVLHFECPQGHITASQRRG